MTAQAKVCSHCKAALPPGAVRCIQCGAPAGRGVRAGLIVLAGAVIVALGVGAVLFRAFFSRGSKEAKNPRIAEELQSTVGRPALEVHGVLKISYRDLGNAVELGVQAKGNPALYVDVNQNGSAEQGISYAASPDGTVCVQRVNTARDSAQCGNVPSAASARVTRQESVWDVLWKIPKKELQHNADGVDFAVRVFHEDTQRGEFYPAEPFAKVYHLQFAAEQAQTRRPRPEERPAPVPIPVPEPAPERPAPTGGTASSGRTGTIDETSIPSITQFEAVPGSLEHGGSGTLRWSVTGASSVSIEPGVGPVTTQGEKTVAPEQTTRYKLTAKGSGGVATSEVTVSVGESAPPQIVSFQAAPDVVAAGGRVHLRWAVSGRTTGVKIVPGFDDLPAQGEREAQIDRAMEFTLTAVGPGGAVSSKVTVRVESVAPPGVRFEVDPATIHQGETATLRWNVTGQAQVTIDPGVGATSPTGAIVVRPLNTTRYTLTATGPRGVVATKDVTLTVGRPSGPNSGVIVWTGDVHGVQLVTIDRDHSDVGSVQGALPGVPCIVQPASDKGVSIASAPGPRNNFERLVLRVQGNGPTRVVIAWSLQ